MIRALDKALPTQPFNSGQFVGEDYDASLAALVTGFARASYRNGFDLQKPDHVDLEELSSPPAMVALLQFLVTVTKARRILEVGTFVGLTTMMLARHAGEDCEVVTIERGQEFALFARGNIAQNGLDDQIAVIVGEGTKVLKGLVRPFDLIFLDGGKQDYLPMARECERLLCAGGVMVIDDVFFHGDALNEQPQTDKGRGCRAVLQHYQGRSDLGSLLLPIGNGVLVVYRRAA